MSSQNVKVLTGGFSHYPFLFFSQEQTHAQLSFSLIHYIEMLAPYPFLQGHTLTRARVHWVHAFDDILCTNTTTRQPRKRATVPENDRPHSFFSPLSVAMAFKAGRRCFGCFWQTDLRRHLHSCGGQTDWTGREGQSSRFEWARRTRGRKNNLCIGKEVELHVREFNSFSCIFS